MHTQDDLDAAVAPAVTPVKTNFEVMTSGNVSSERPGEVALMLLNIVSGMDKFGDHPISLERIHHRRLDRSSRTS